MKSTRTQNLASTNTPVSIANYDVYGAAPVIPTGASDFLAPTGARVYGARILGDQDHTVATPAFEENNLSLLLSQSANFSITTDRTRSFYAQAGDFMLVPRGLPVKYEFNTSGDADSLLISLPSHLLQQSVARDLDGQPQDVELHLVMAEKRDPLIYGIGWAIYHHIQTLARDRLYVEAMLNTLVVHLLGSYAVSKPRRPRATRSLKPLCPTVLRRVCDYIEAHLDSALTLDEIGNVAQYSPFHLARLFRSATGKTLHHYVTLRRLARAKDLLETTDLPLQQIAQQTGFADQSHLANHFRRAYGYCPSTERKLSRRP